MKTKATDRTFLRFTRSSVIVYPIVVKKLGLKDLDVFYDAVLHDVNGSGVLYGINKTDYLGDYDVIENPEDVTVIKLIKKDNE